MKSLLIVVFGFHILVLQVVDSGLIKNEPYYLPRQDELGGLNFQNIKHDSRENEHQMLKTIIENGYVKLPVRNEERGEIQSKTKISLTSNTKSDQQSHYNCGTKNEKTWPSTSQPLNTNQKFDITQIVQKTVENLEKKMLCPSHPLALQITQQTTEKTIPASDSILFINDNQNVFLSSENRNQSEFHIKQKTNKTTLFNGTEETEVKFQKTPSTNITPLTPNSTTKNVESKSNLKDDQDDIILKSDSITCLHSTRKGFGNVENVTMICNDTNCVLKASTQKSTSWLCGSFICHVAKGVNLDNYDEKDKLVMDCSAEDRSLIAAPLKCLPDEKFVNDKCRKIYKV